MFRGDTWDLMYQNRAGFICVFVPAVLVEGSSVVIWLRCSS